MRGRRSEDFVRELSAGLAPVRPIPPLRRALTLVFATWGVAIATRWALGGPPPCVGIGCGWRDPLSWGLTIGLVLAAAGGIVAALAHAVPGRARLAAVGASALLVGLALALASSGFALLLETAPPRTPLAAAAGCGTHAVLLGFVPAALVCRFAARAFERRPGRSAVMACLGGVALGAIVVQLSCGAGDPRHLLLGHALAPIGAALLLAVPSAALLHRSLARRAATSAAGAGCW
jgi:hypothetical protein